MRVCDYICQRLADLGVTDVFLVTGGGAMFLNDAIGRESRFTVIPTHHEQSASIAAEGYARYKGQPALVNVTTGPGGINAINGVFGAHTDSVPMIIVSGQVKRETMVSSYDLPLRQLGDQEVDIISMVKGVTKFATVLRNPNDAPAIIDKAYHLATSGRPGPVWIDVPIDVQAAIIDPDKCPAIAKDEDPDCLREVTSQVDDDALQRLVATVIERLSAAARPVILGGGGVRASGQYDAFSRIIEKIGAPVVTGWNAHDLLPNSHALYAGKPGSVGDRPGNFTVQNSDFLLVLGSRLNIRQVSYNYSCFAREAFKVMVDVDEAELRKPTLSIDLPICCSLERFLPALEAALEGYEKPATHDLYLDWAREKVRTYPVLLPEYMNKQNPINPYYFVDVLFDCLEEGDVVVTGDGTACVVSFQGAKLKQGQRLFTNSGCASMGYDLPAALGAYFGGAAQTTGRVICLAGDGSIMMNIQELATISGRRLPIKIFVLNNDGYHSIRQTQQNHFAGNVIGCGPDSGLAFPDFCQLATGFGLASSRCEDHGALKACVEDALNSEGPHLCEIVLDKAQQFAPKVSSRRLEDGRMVSAPLEDLAPFLDREEFKRNMLIPVVEQ